MFRNSIKMIRGRISTALDDLKKDKVKEAVANLKSALCYANGLIKNIDGEWGNDENFS